MATDGPAALRRLSGDFELNKAACWNKSDTADIWKLAAAWEAEREQAAADRAALGQARALLAEWRDGYDVSLGAYVIDPVMFDDLLKALGGAR